MAILSTPLEYRGRGQSGVGQASYLTKGEEYCIIGKTVGEGFVNVHQGRHNLQIKGRGAQAGGEAPVGVGVKVGHGGSNRSGVDK